MTMITFDKIELITENKLRFYLSCRLNKTTFQYSSDYSDPILNEFLNKWNYCLINEFPIICKRILCFPKVKITSTFQEQLKNIFPNSIQSTALKRYETWVTFCPHPNYVHPEIFALIKDKNFRLFNCDLISEIFSIWLLPQLSKRCFLKFLFAWVQEYKTQMKLTSEFLSLPCLLKLLDFPELKLMKLVQFPGINSVLISSSNLPISSKLIDTNSILFPLNTNGHGKLILKTSTKEIKASKVTINPFDDNLIWTESLSEKVHSVFNFNNRKMCLFLKKKYNVSFLTKLQFEFPNRRIDKQYWDNSTYDWNLFFTNFEFQIPIPNIYQDLSSENKNKTAGIKKMAIITRIKNVFEDTFYKIFEFHSGKGIFMRYPIESKKLIEYLTLLLFVHPKHYHKYLDTENFYFYFKEISDLFIWNIETLSSENKTFKITSESTLESLNRNEKYNDFQKHVKYFKHLHLRYKARHSNPFYTNHEFENYNNQENLMFNFLFYQEAKVKYEPQYAIDLNQLVNSNILQVKKKFQDFIFTLKQENQYNPDDFEIYQLQYVLNIENERDENDV